MWFRTLGVTATPLVVAYLIVLYSTQAIGAVDPQWSTLRVGFLPNVTHAPVWVGLADGDFQAALVGIEIDPRVFGSGPAVVEALFAGEIDLAYLGPNPIVNAWYRSGGAAVRIVAGSTLGGAGLVVQPDWAPREVADFLGRRIGTPQTGNTQDISLRGYLLDHRIPLGPDGVRIVPAGNPELLILFARGDIDGAWVTEPWLTRLVLDYGGRLWVDERTLWPDGRFATALVAARPELLASAPELVEAWLAVHIDVSRRLRAEPELAARVTHALSEWFGYPMPQQVVEGALQRLAFDWEPPMEATAGAAEYAYRLGFLGERPVDLTGIYALEPLRAALERVREP